MERGFLLEKGFFFLFLEKYVSRKRPRLSSHTRSQEVGLGATETALTSHLVPRYLNSGLGPFHSQPSLVGSETSGGCLVNLYAV